MTRRSLRIALVGCLVSASALACTKKGNERPSPIPVATPQVRASQTLSGPPEGPVVWANASEIALTRGLEPSDVAAAERLSWAPSADNEHEIAALRAALEASRPSGNQATLVVDAALEGGALVRLLYTLNRVDFDHHAFVFGWPPAGEEPLSLAHTQPMKFGVIEEDDGIRDAMSGPGVLILKLDHSRVHLATKHGQDAREIPVLVDGDSCELPPADVHASLAGIAARLCEVQPAGFHLLVDIDPATPFADIAELFADDPRPERCRQSVVFEAFEVPPERSCEGGASPEDITMTPWPPRPRVYDPDRAAAHMKVLRESAEKTESGALGP